METFAKKLEVAANVAIVVVAVLLSTVLVRSYLAAPSEREDVKPSVQAQRTLQNGESINLPGIDWQKNGRTLLMALSTTCHFCTESGPFYQRLVREGGIPLIAVVPQDAAEGRAYLDRINVPVGDVRQIPLSAIGVEGTPTLMLVDDKGVVLNSWVGKLPASKEAEVLSEIE